MPPLDAHDWRVPTSYDGEEGPAMLPSSARCYGWAAVVSGALFMVSDFVALLVANLDDPGTEFAADAYAV